MPEPTYHDTAVTGAQLDLALERLLTAFEIPSKTQAELDALTPDGSSRVIYHNTTTDELVRWDGAAFQPFANVIASRAGNARGTSAVDLQQVRSAASQVASGTRSTILGGQNNTASANDAVAGGSGTTASGAAAVAIGSSVTASGASSAAFGSSTEASAAGALASGVGATARHTGAHVLASNSIGQAGRVLLSRTTANATPTELFIDGSSERFVLPDSTAVAIHALAIATATDGSAQAGYLLSGVLHRGAGAATTALLGSATKTVLYETNSAWDLTLTANTTHGAAVFTATGGAGLSVLWTVRLDWVEVTY